MIKYLKRFYYIIRFTPQKYWNERAKNYGIRSVYHSGHSMDELQSVTELQVNALFPILKKELTGNEKTVLDFGCGPGRFTKKLADLLRGGTALGVDFIEYLLTIAPKSENIDYKVVENGKIPAADNSFDIIWICHVLGCIVNERKLSKTVIELDRVAKKGALIFLVENTSDLEHQINFKFRKVSEYEEILSIFNLKNVGCYEDLGQRMSIFIGRK